MKQRKGEAKIFTIATIQNKYHYFYETKCAVSMKALNFTQIKSCKSIRQHFCWQKWPLFRLRYILCFTRNSKTKEGSVSVTSIVYEARTKYMITKTYSMYMQWNKCTKLSLFYKLCFVMGWRGDGSSKWYAYRNKHEGKSNTKMNILTGIKMITFSTPNRAKFLNNM